MEELFDENSATLAERCAQAQVLETNGSPISMQDVHPKMI